MTNLPTISHPTDRPNFTQATVGALTVWYSYTTPVAFQRTDDPRPTVIRNYWSNTTGRHLNQIDGGSAAAKARRLDHDAFTAALVAAANTEPVQ